jgi:hypothetical protein
LLAEELLVRETRVSPRPLSPSKGNNQAMPTYIGVEKDVNGYCNIPSGSVTWSAFLKRNYVYVNTKQPLEREEKKRILICNNDKKLYFNDQEVAWMSPNKKRKLMSPEGRVITKDAFIKRNYLYKDTQEPTTTWEKGQANIHDDGKVFVQDREIVWCHKGTKRKRRDSTSMKETQPWSNDHLPVRPLVIDPQQIYKTGYPGMTVFAPRLSGPQSSTRLTSKELLALDLDTLGSMRKKIG